MTKEDRHLVQQKVGAILGAPEIYNDLKESIRLAVSVAYEAFRVRIARAREERRRSGKALHGR